MAGICLRLFVLVLFLSLISPFAVLGEEGELDAVLGGFDEPADGAAADTGLDDVFSGFGDEVAPEKGDLPALPAAKKVDESSWLTFSGGLTLSAAYNYAHKQPEPGRTDHRDLSRLRTAFDIEAEGKLADNWQAKIGAKAFYDGAYSLQGREEYLDELLDRYEHEEELTEVYLQGSLLPSLDLRLGRQVVVWGKSDNIRVTDILNPLDNREPGVVDIRDLRLPVTMSKLDYYFGEWNLSAIMLHEVRFNKEPVFGNDFFPGSAPSPDEEKPGTSLDNQEYGLAANGIFSGWDLSFYGAHLFDDQSHLENSPAGMRRRHNQINMLGSSINIARGNWLYKGEAAYLDGLEYSIDVGSKNRLDMLLGTEYSGFSETVLSLEVVNRHIFSFDDRLRAGPVWGKEDELQYVLRLNRDLYNDTLKLTLLLSTFGLRGEDGAFQRFSAEYELSDSLRLSGGLINYEAGNKAMFRNTGANDRIFAELRYSF